MGPAKCLRGRTGPKVDNLSIPGELRSGSVQSSHSLSGTHVGHPPGAAEMWDLAFPRTEGLEPGTVDSDPRAAPHMPDGLGQVIPLFLK